MTVEYEDGNHYSHVEKASALVDNCGEEDVKDASSHLGHREEDSRQRRVTHINVPITRDLKKLQCLA